jgi:hypothetical protein
VSAQQELKCENITHEMANEFIFITCKIGFSFHRAIAAKNNPANKQARNGKAFRSIDFAKGKFCLSSFVSLN